MRVIIVGAGAIGSSTAYFLSQKPDVEVIVIEQTHVAAAASGKAGGFLARDWCSGPLDALARRSFDLHAELADKHNNPWQYRRLDTVSVKQSGRSQARVEDIAWLDGVEKGQAGVMGTPATTAQVTPELYTKGMMQLAIDNGARLTTASVVGLNRSATGDVDGVELADGSVVKADKVVLCMGPWTGKAREWIPSLPDVAGSKAYSIVVQPKEPDAITPHAIFVSYTTRDKMKHPEIYPRPDGTVYMCGAMDDTPLPSTADQVAGSEEAARRLHAIMGECSSTLRESTVVKTQGCYLPSSPDSYPLLGSVPEVKGLYLATGHTCWGILNAPGTGEAMADILNGDETAVDVSGLLVSRLYA